MNRFSLVVFDWEGTLGDPAGQVLKLLLEQACAMGLPAVDEVFARQSIVLGLEHGVSKLFPNLALHQYERLLHGVQQTLRTHALEPDLFPGAKLLVQELHEAHVHLAIATNKSAQSLQRALQSTGLSHYFPVTRTADQLPPKPSPRMLEDIMEEVNVSPEHTLMIGDSVSDIEMAIGAHVLSIGVDFYHQQADDLRSAGAVHVFDDYVHIGRYLELPGYEEAL